MSLRARLLAGMAVVSFVLVGAAVIVARTTRANLVERVDHQLSSVGALTPGVGAGSVAGPTQFYGAQLQDGVIVSVIQPTTNTDSLGSPTFTVDEVIRGARVEEPFTVGTSGGSGRFRMLATRAPDGSVNLVGLSLQDVDSTMNRLRIVLIVAVALVIAILGLVVFWVLRLGVRPIKRMTRTAGAIAAGDLSQRVPDGAPRHRGVGAGRRAQLDDGDDRGRVRREGRVGGTVAPVRRRRVARAAHPGHDDPGLRRAVPPRWARRDRRPRPGNATHRAGSGAHGVVGRRPGAPGASRRGTPARASTRWTSACSGSTPPPTDARSRPIGR